MSTLIFGNDFLVCDFTLVLPINVNGQNELDGLYRCALFQILEEKQYFDTLERDKLLPDLKWGLSSDDWLNFERLLVSCLVVEEKLNSLQPN